MTVVKASKFYVLQLAVAVPVVNNYVSNKNLWQQIIVNEDELPCIMPSLHWHKLTQHTRSSNNRLVLIRSGKIKAQNPFKHACCVHKPVGVVATVNKEIIGSGLHTVF